MNTGKLIANIVLFLGIVGLSYLLYKSIEEPITVEKARNKRQSAAHARLLDIKKAQMVYLEANGKFAANFDQLIGAVKRDSLAEVKIIGNPDDLEADSTLVITYDTIYVSIMRRAFNRDDYPADSLRFIPFTGGKKFNMQAGTITELGSTVPVFEVSVTERELLYDQVQKYVSKDVVWKVGSMEEARYDGNWE